MAISTNYLGKQIDFCILDTSTNPGEEQIEVGLFAPGSVIAGPYKVAQKFLKFLLTELGSVPSELTYGTDFIRLLLTGQIQNAEALKLRFYQEVGNIINYVQSANTSASPDEQLVSVNLEAFDVIGDYAILRIKLQFNDQSTILAPVRIATV